MANFTLRLDKNHDKLMREIMKKQNIKTGAEAIRFALRNHSRSTEDIRNETVAVIKITAKGDILVNKENKVD